MTFRYKRAVPSEINKALQRREINAAFISSVASAKCQCTDLGIIAYQKVYSVLLLEGENEIDPASATSNQLARVLDLQGKVLIGDAALKHYLNGGTDQSKNSPIHPQKRSKTKRNYAQAAYLVFESYPL